MKRWVEGDLTKVKLTSESHGAQLDEIIEAAERELAHKMNDLDEMKNLINTFWGLDNQILYKKIVKLGLKSNIWGVITTLTIIQVECAAEMDKKFPGKSNCE